MIKSGQRRNILCFTNIALEVFNGSFTAFSFGNNTNPLKMKNTAIRTLEQKAAIKNFALGHIFIPEKNAYVRADSFPSSNYTIWLGNRKGPGRISSTVEDLLKWDQALYSGKLIQPTTLDQAFTPMTLTTGKISNYGFGWELIPQDNIVWHNGDNPGYKTIIVRFLENKATLIILCNNASDAFENLTSDLKKLIQGH